MDDEDKEEPLGKATFDKAGKLAHSQILTPYVINGIAIVVTLVWAASFVADVTVEGYNPPGQIHMVMLGIVGSIFGFQIVHRNGDG